MKSVANTNPSFPRIALTGGIACGKSLVARYLNELGVETIDADDIVHDLIPDPAERRRIAAEVFSDPVKRRALEAKLHPVVKERIEAFLSQGKGLSTLDSRLSQDSSQSVPIREIRGSKIRLAIIPLLFEVHWNENFDIICAVVSERETQISRMMTTRGYTREQAEARLAAQMPVEEKAAKSNYVINNNGTAEELKEEAKKFVSWLKAR